MRLDVSEERIDPQREELPDLAVPTEAEQDEALAEAAEQVSSDGVVAPADLAQGELAVLRAQAAEYLDGWQRSRAEFANFKRRVEREQEEARLRIAGEVLVRYLSVVDDLERALKDRPVEGEIGSWANGIEMIYRKLRALLEAEGVETIAADDAAFDPNLHEAVTHEDSPDHRPGDIIEVIRRGYRIGDRVLRPSQVRVAR
jgi:molecular chaperone GrpE